MTRKVVTRAPHREVGIVNSGWLLDHPVQHESHLERRFIMAVLGCPVVCDIRHQPMTLQVPDPTSHKQQRYTPDFLVTLRDGASVVVEVKPKSRLKPHLQKLQAAETQLNEQGHSFFIATDELIDGRNLSMRAMHLMRYARLHWSEVAAQEAITAVQKQGRDTFSVSDLVKLGVPEHLVWALVARHTWHVPSDFLMEPSQIITVTPCEGDCHDYFWSWFGASLG